MTFIRIFDMLILSGDRDQSRLSEIAPLEWGQYETLELFEFSRFFFWGGGNGTLSQFGCKYLFGVTSITVRVVR